MKFIAILIFSIFIFTKLCAVDRESELNNLFDQLKINDSSMNLKQK